MNVTLRLGSCLLLLAGVLGCNAVYLTEPIGGEPVVLISDEWNGDWSFPDEGSGKVFVTNAEVGELTLAEIEEKNGKLEIHQLRATLRPGAKEGEWLVTMTDDEKTTGDPERLIFAGLLKREKNHAILWAPVPNLVSARIDAGELPGTPGGGDDAYLGKVDVRQIDMITSPALMLLNWKEPAAILKVR